MKFIRKNCRNRLLMTGISIAALFSFCSSGVFAYWQVTGRTTNMLSMNSYRTEIQETYTVPEAVFPGTEVDKVVHVTNTGSTDCFVRVQINTAFGIRDADGRFTQDESLSTDVIEIDFNEDYWMQKDNFWYYRDVLKAGSRTKEPLFQSFRISEKAGNAYRGKDAEIVVAMESIQAEGNTLELWGMTQDALGIHYESSDRSETTAVEYLGGEQGFLFEGLGTDLFTNFKNLLPGCARTQHILIRNSSSAPVTLLLHAEPAEQNALSAKELALIDQMLSKYAQIEIWTEDRMLYSGPVDGNPDGVPESSMGQQSGILLGSFSAGQERDLIVRLNLSPKMDSMFCELTGKVDWVFTAQGEETAAASVPKTGDPTRIAIPALLFTGSSLCLLFLMLLRKENRYGHH